ncbi:MAG: amidohydrolase family protein [Myxococcota bacterium]
MSDLLIRGGRVVDGTGRPVREADVRVRGGVIVEIAPGLRPQGEREIDASGAFVSPGFIEQHTHYDGSLWWDPFCDPMPGFGTTTCVIGNCGHSLAPIRARDRDALIDLFCFIEDLPNEAFAEAIPWRWESWPEYADAAKAHPLGVNVAPLVGHTPIRVYVMGEAAWERAATEDELRAMERVLSESLAAGAFGLAGSDMDTDRHGRPVPCRLGVGEERRRLFRLLARERRIAMDAVRLLDPRYFAADLEQLAADCRATGVRGLWAALMSTTGEEATRREILGLHRQYVAEGLDLWGQTAGRPQAGAIHFERSILFQGIDAWHEMVNADAARKTAMLRDPRWRERARHDWDHADFVMFPKDRLDNLVVGHCQPAFARFRGMPLDRLVVERGGGHPSDAFADWLLDNGTVGTGFAPLRGPNDDLDGICELLTEPQMLSGASDAGAHIQIMCAAGESTYVLIEHVRDGGRLTIEQAVHAFTGRQADFFGIGDRGRLAPGYRADLAVFDLDALAHPADRPVRDLPCDSWRYTKSPAGYRATIVNGEPTWLDGALTGARPGGFLDPTARV